MRIRTAGRLLWLLAALAWAPAWSTQAPLLWRIEGPRADHYLMGAVHLLPASTQPLPAAMETAYASADVLVFETDLAALQTPALQQRFLAAAQAADGLHAQISPATYEALQTHLQGLGMLGAAFDGFDPWFAAMTLERLRFQQAGFSPAYGTDSYYFGRAQQDGKAIAWLESPEEQIEVLDGMSAASAEAYLRGMIAEDLPSGPSPQALLEIWRNSDLSALEAITQEMQRDYPALHERLLASRNARWMTTLPVRLRGRQPHLIIVGAAHLPGENGLLRRLRSAGFALSAVED